MDSMFTQETINKIIELLSTATTVGGTAAIVYLSIPIVLALITTGAWLVGFWQLFKYLHKIVAEIYSEARRKAELAHELEQTKLTIRRDELSHERWKLEQSAKPQEMTLGGMPIDKSVDSDIRTLLRDFYKDMGYIHSSDVTRLRKDLEDVRAKRASKDT